MLTRRIFLQNSTALSLCAVAPSLALLRPDPVEFITQRVRESLEAFADISEVPFHGVWNKSVYQWISWEDLSIPVRLELTALKEDITCISPWCDETGRLRLGIQYLIMERFPFVPDMCDRALFDAFNTYLTHSA